MVKLDKLNVEQLHHSSNTDVVRMQVMSWTHISSGRENKLGGANIAIMPLTVQRQRHSSECQSTASNTIFLCLQVAC